MQNRLIYMSTVLVVSGLFAGCMMKDDTNPSGSGAGGPGSGGATDSSSSAGGSGPSSSSTSMGPGSGGGGSGPGMPGWTAVPLIDDMTDPMNPVFRSGNDLVTGIYYASIDDGWVVTNGSEQTFGNGGAIFKSSSKKVESVLFGGNRDGLCLLGTIDFHGIDKSPDGLVALGYACDIIASHDGGKTFGIEPALVGDTFGIEQVLTMRSRMNGTLMVADSGYISSTPGAPGPNAVWSDVWAPQANPPTPNPVPPDQCQGGPKSSTVPAQRGSVFVSAKGDFIAYTSAPNFDPQVCISEDGGKSFFPKLLPNVPADAQDFMPSGVTFATDTTGIAFWANNIYPGEGYIYQTTDRGKTWKSVPLPPEVASKSIELQNAFFAPDGMHGWIVGFDYDASIALMIRTADGGATWKAASGDLAQQVDKAGGGKLFTGFALDANHIWVGGERGILMQNSAGGD